jgi:hypothetical protein
VRNLDGTVTEIVGDDTFSLRPLTVYADGVPWSDVDAIATSGCAVRRGGDVRCASGQPLASSDVVVDVGAAALLGDGMIRTIGPPVAPAGTVVDRLPLQEAVFVELLQDHPLRGALLCTVSTAAVLTCGDRVFDPAGGGITVDGILMPD